MEVHHPDVQSAADSISKFCGRWSKQLDGARLLIMTGQTGCGKTRMARRVSGWAQAAAFAVYCESRSNAIAIPAVSFIEWSTASTPEKLDERSWIERLSEIDADSLVVVDDIGSEVDRFKTGANIERLCMLLNRRAGKFTIITTNHAPETWHQVWDARVSDRLLRNSEVVRMKCSSYSTVA